MSRCFSNVTVHSIENGMARLSQNHYRITTDDEGVEYRSEETTRECSINVRPDETRKSLFNRLNNSETWIINMGGTLEKTDRIVRVTNDFDMDLDD